MRVSTGRLQRFVFDQRVAHFVYDGIGLSSAGGGQPAAHAVPYKEGLARGDDDVVGGEAAAVCTGKVIYGCLEEKAELIMRRLGVTMFRANRNRAGFD